MNKKLFKGIFSLLTAIVFMGSIALSFSACDDNGGNNTSFVAVTSITGVPESGNINAGITLTGTVNPSNATNRTISWSIYNQGGTESTLEGNILTAENAGTVTVRATIINGLTENTNFTQDFEIAISDPNASLSSAKAITAFSVNGVSGFINEVAKTITLTLPYGTVGTIFTPVVTVSPNADYSPKGAQDFSSPRTFTVTAEDGSTQDYTVTVTVFEPKIWYGVWLPAGVAVEIDVWEYDPDTGTPVFENTDPTSVNGNVLNNFGIQAFDIDALERVFNGEPSEVNLMTWQLLNGYLQNAVERPAVAANITHRFQNIWGDIVFITPVSLGEIVIRDSTGTIATAIFNRHTININGLLYYVYQLRNRVVPNNGTVNTTYTFQVGTN